MDYGRPHPNLIDQLDQHDELPPELKARIWEIAASRVSARLPEVVGQVFLIHGTVRDSGSPQTTYYVAVKTDYESSRDVFSMDGETRKTIPDTRAFTDEFTFVI